MTLIRQLVIVILIFAQPYTREGREAAYTEERQRMLDRWVGVRAPEFGPNVRDRLLGDRLTLKQFEGRKLLLYSFRSGDFVNGADPSVFPENLRRLQRGVERSGVEDVAIIGITSGIWTFLPDAEQTEELRALSRFPIVVGLRSADCTKPNPYRLLDCYGGMVIDRNGVIQSVHAAPMTEAQIQTALQQPDWPQPVRPAPSHEPDNEN